MFYFNAKVSMFPLSSFLHVMLPEYSQELFTYMFSISFVICGTPVFLSLTICLHKCLVDNIYETHTILTVRTSFKSKHSSTNF